MPYRVYVLRNTQGLHYIGLSEDVAKRFGQHNAGESQWTAKHRPWEIVWQSHSMSLSEVRKFENLLKRQKGGAGFYRLTGLQPTPSTGS